MGRKVFKLPNVAFRKIGEFCISVHYYSRPVLLVYCVKRRTAIDNSTANAMLALFHYRSCITFFVSSALFTYSFFVVASREEKECDWPSDIEKIFHVAGFLEFWGIQFNVVYYRRTTFSGSEVHGLISISGNVLVCEEYDGENEGRTKAFSHKTYCR